MSNTTALADLIDRLHEANRQLAEAARPLEHLSELNEEQQKQLGDQLRAGLAHWELVTHEINRLLGSAAPTSGPASVEPTEDHQRYA